MPRTLIVVLLAASCAMYSCADTTKSQPASRPAPEYVELTVHGPTEWSDQFVEMDDMERYEITLPAGQFDQAERISLFNYRSRHGRHSGGGGGSLLQGDTREVDVEHLSTIVLATSRVHFAVSEPHTFDLRNGKGVVQYGKALRLKMLPAAQVKLVIPDDSPLVDAAYDVHRMDGFKLYHDFRAAKKGSGGFRMLEAGKEHRLVRLHHPEEIHVIGPFDAGTRNEVVLTPSVIGG